MKGTRRCDLPPPPGSSAIVPCVGLAAHPLRRLRPPSLSCASLTFLHCRAASCAAREQLLHGAARFEVDRGPSTSDRTPFRINKPLLEHVVKDVLEVEEGRGIIDVDELRGCLFALLEVDEGAAL